jgi:hypothetical protein
MTVLEALQQQVKQLPPAQQLEVLDFAEFLRQRLTRLAPDQPRSLRRHPAFGAWRKRQIDALQYEQALRAEWEEHP